jgi:Putative abortive phage resistance protein AbiGi, antitoxin
MRYVERLLVHWTGRDTCRHNLFPIPAEYSMIAKRAISTLVHGIWLTPDNSEPVYGGNVQASWSGTSEDLSPADDEIEADPVLPHIRRARIKHSPATYRACFTEVPLQNAIHHARRYGPVGIALTRQAVLSRWGAPVQYVRNGSDEVLVWQYARLESFLKYLCNSPDMPISGKLLERAKDALHAFHYVQVHLKPMSPPDQPDSFWYLEEREWRVGWTRSKVAAKEADLFKSIHDDSRGIDVVKHFLNKTREPRPHYLMPLEPRDVVALVVPNDEIRKKVLHNREFKNWCAAFSVDVPIPYMLTFDELAGFDPHEP